MDLGANIGAFDIWIGTVKKDIKKLIAVEPEESNMQSLKLNTQQESHIICYHAGIWNKCCELKIVPRDTGEWGVTVREALEHEVPDVRAIDMWKIISDNALERIHILKMDIEGSEYEVFSENYEWISLVDMLIVETHERFKPGSEKRVIDRMTEYGFVYEKIGEDFVFVRG